MIAQFVAGDFHRNGDGVRDYERGQDFFVTGQLVDHRIRENQLGFAGCGEQYGCFADCTPQRIN
jgi:hypothetical protein